MRAGDDAREEREERIRLLMSWKEKKRGEVAGASGALLSTGEKGEKGRFALARRSGSRSMRNDLWKGKGKERDGAGTLGIDGSRSSKKGKGGVF